MGEFVRGGTKRAANYKEITPAAPTFVRGYKGGQPSAGRLATISGTPEIPDQLGKFVVFSIEVRDRYTEDSRQPLQRLQIWLVDARLIAIDASAGDEIVQTSFDAEVALRNAVGLTRFAESAAVDGQLLLLVSHAPSFP